MLKARAFVEIDLEQREAEKTRLELLHTQIDEQPLKEKRRLLNEFLEIVGNRDDKLQRRIQACNILGGRRKELGINGSRAVTSKLRNILEREFFIFRRSGLLFLNREIRLREVGPIRFCFLEVLLLSLLRIDYGNMFLFVEQVASKVENPQSKAKLTKLLADEKRRLKKNYEK